MKRTLTNSAKSGQALIITSLIIAMLLLSTVYYVFEVKRGIINNDTTEDSTIEAIKLSTVKSLTSALANFTNGGEKGVLSSDLNELSSAIAKHSYGAECYLQFAPLNSLPYQDGLWVSWETNGSGISSGYVDFLLNFSGPSTAYCLRYERNVTTALTIEGVYTGIGQEKSVNVTYRMLNEKETALVNDVSIFYQNQPGGPWILVNSSSNLNVIDYGNGTYFTSFDLFAQDYLQVSANAHDTRDIFVMANVTCVEV